MYICVNLFMHVIHMICFVFAIGTRYANNIIGLKEIIIF